MPRLRWRAWALGALCSSLAIAAELPERISLDGEARGDTSPWRIHETLPNRWASMRHLFLRQPRADPRGWLPDANRPEAWIRATVPGAVLADLVAAGVVADPFVGLQSRAAEWVSQRDWIYSRSFEVPESWRGSRVQLRFEGIDPGGVVLVNGVELATHRGMFVPLELDVTGALRFGASNALDVIVFHAPDQQPRPQTENDQLPWKARFATGWDFAPRLVPVGLWGGVELRRTGACALRSASARARLEGKSGLVDLRAAFDGSCGVVEAVLRRQGRELVRRVIARTGDGVAAGRLALERPELWFPNGLGSQPLYEVEVSARDEKGAVSDRATRTIGFRDLVWTRAAGASENDPPDGVLVAGRPAFLKGWNWVPAHQLYGTVRADRSERLLGLARDSGANLLRVWGGGLVESEAFYELADRFGLLVWQESPLTSAGGRENLPSEAPDWVAAASKELRTVLERRRHHVSLAIWDGGNELVGDDWRPIRAAHPYARASQAVVAELAPDLLWLPTSPSGAEYFASVEARGRMGDVHGPWRFLGSEAHPAFYDAIDPRLHSEFSVPAISNLESLRAIASETELWPPGLAKPIWAHHDGSWFDRAQLESLFGPVAELPTAVRLSQFLQAEGLRYAVEAHRRRFPRTIGCLPWQLNEPWPAVAGNFVVDFRGEPLAGYWGVRRAFAPLSLSASYPRIAWKPNQEFEADLWAIDDRGPGGAESAAPQRWRYRLEDAAGRAIAEGESALGPLKPGPTATRIASVRAPLTSVSNGALLFRAELVDAAGRTLAEHRSVHVVSEKGDLVPLRAVAPTRVVLEWVAGDRVEIRNVGERLALGVRLFAPGGTLDDNVRFLAPGERWQVSVAGSSRETLRLEWWNR